MEAYIKQKRASPGMVQASELQMSRPKSAHTNSRHLHAYDGPMQYLASPQNPDQIVSTPLTTVTKQSMTRATSLQSSHGENSFHIP